MGEGFSFRGSPHSPPLFPLGWCAFALLAIVRLLCSLGNVIIADAQSKRLCWPYKRRLAYQVMGSWQDGATSANQLSVRTGGRQGRRDAGERGRTEDRTERGSVAGRDSQRQATITSQHTATHPTRLPPDLLLARALRLGKYPMSKIFCAKVTRQVIIYQERYNAMGRYLSVV
jgi:hypothetical protein